MGLHNNTNVHTGKSKKQRHLVNKENLILKVGKSVLSVSQSIKNLSGRVNRSGIQNLVAVNSNPNASVSDTMAPALTEPLSPTEELSSSPASATPTTRSNRKFDSVALASTSSHNAISTVANREKKNRTSPTVGSLSRKTRSKGGAYQRAFEQSVAVVPTTSESGNVHLQNHKINNEQMGLSATVNNNNNETNLAPKATANCKENNTEKLLADLTNDFEEAITAEICLRKQLLDSNLGKEASQSNASDPKDILVIKATTGGLKEVNSQPHMESQTTVETQSHELQPQDSTEDEDQHEEAEQTAHKTPKDESTESKESIELEAKLEMAESLPASQKPAKEESVRSEMSSVDVLPPVGTDSTITASEVENNLEDCFKQLNATLASVPVSDESTTATSLARTSPSPPNETPSPHSQEDNQELQEQNNVQLQQLHKEELEEQPQLNQQLEEQSPLNQLLEEQSQPNNELEDQPQSNQELEDQPQSNQELEDQLQPNQELEEQPQLNQPLPEPNQQLEEQPQPNQQLQEQPETNQQLQEEETLQPTSTTPTSQVLQNVQNTTSTSQTAAAASSSTLNSANQTQTFSKESGGGEIEDHDIEEVLKVLKGFEAATSGGDSLCDLNVLFNEVYTTLNYDEVSTQPVPQTVKPNPLREMQLEIAKNQQTLQNKIDFLLRRMHKFQARYMCKHASEEIAGLFEWSARTVGKGACNAQETDEEEATNSSAAVISTRPSAFSWAADKNNPVPASQMCAMLRKVETVANEQMISTAPSTSSNNLSQLKKPKKVLDNHTSQLSSNERKRAVVVPIFDANTVEEITQVSGLLHSEMRFVQKGLDLDATDSSSGSESAEETVTYNNQIKQPLPIIKRAAWRFAHQRAAIASRWSWLLSHVSDLDIKIRQQYDALHEIMQTKTNVVCDEEVTPKNYESSISASATASTSVNGYKGDISISDAGDLKENFEDVLPGSCRTRGYVPSLFRKRKLVQTTNIHTISKKAARPTTIKCGCQWPLLPCAVCTGRSDPTAPRDLPDTMMMTERVATLDPGYHASLSFPKEINAGINFEAYARWPEWQQRLVRSQAKSIAKSIWKAEREAATAAGHQLSRKYGDTTIKRRYIKKKIRSTRTEEAGQKGLGGGGEKASPNDTANGTGTLSTSTTPLVANNFTKMPRKVHCHLVGDGVLLEPLSSSAASLATNHNQNSSHSYIHQTSDYPPKRYDQFNPNQTHSSLISSNSNRNSKHRKYSATNAYYHHNNNNQQNYYNNSQYYNSNGNSELNYLPLSDNWDNFATRSRPTSPTLGNSSSNYHKYERSLERKHRNSYDIDNIVIPYSVAAATRVEILPYKEIPTPKWRVIEYKNDQRVVSHSEDDEKDVSEVSSTKEAANNRVNAAPLDSVAATTASTSATSKEIATPPGSRSHSVEPLSSDTSTTKSIETPEPEADVNKRKITEGKKNNNVLKTAANTEVEKKREKPPESGKINEEKSTGEEPTAKKLKLEDTSEVSTEIPDQQISTEPESKKKKTEELVESAAADISTDATKSEQLVEDAVAHNSAEVAVKTQKLEKLVENAVTDLAKVAVKPSATEGLVENAVSHISAEARGKPSETEEVVENAVTHISAEVAVKPSEAEKLVENPVAGISAEPEVAKMKAGEELLENSGEQAEILAEPTIKVKNELLLGITVEEICADMTAKTEKSADSTEELAENAVEEEQILAKPSVPKSAHTPKEVLEKADDHTMQEPPVKRMKTAGKGKELVAKAVQILIEPAAVAKIRTEDTVTEEAPRGSAMPKWEEINTSIATKPKNVSCELDLMNENSLDVDEDEDISDKAIIMRHESALAEERRKFQTYLRFPWSTRSRANRRIDSRAESSGANTPDPASPAPQTPSIGGGDQESIPSPLAPSTPLNSLDGIPESAENAASNSIPPPISAAGVFINNISKRNNERRRTTSMKKEREVERRSLTPDSKELIPPYEPLNFPLTEEVFENLQRAMPSNCQNNYKYFEDCHSAPSTRRKNSLKSEFGVKRNGKSVTNCAASVRRLKNNARNYKGDGVEEIAAGAAGMVAPALYENGKDDYDFDDVDDGDGGGGADDDNVDEDAAAELDGDEDDEEYDDDDGIVNDYRKSFLETEDVYGNEDYEAYVGHSLLGNSDTESSEPEPFQDDDPNDPEWKGEPAERMERFRKRI